MLISDSHGFVFVHVRKAAGTSLRPDANRVGSYHPALRDGYRFYVQTFADLLTELDGVPDGAGGETMLDTSMVVLATDFGNGFGHSANKSCWILAGNLGSARTGYHYNAAPGVPDAGQDRAHLR